MEWVGSAIRLEPQDIVTVANEMEVPPAALRAVQLVEAAGSGFDAAGRPKALFERHHFYKHLRDDDELLQQAIDEGLAYPKWGTRPYPKGSDAVYDEIERAAEIEVEAALLSTSWGLGQIMGSNYKMVGCANVIQMWEEAKESEINQLRHMASFIESARLADHMRSQNWAAFAKGYNGPGYAQNKYDQKLEAAFDKACDDPEYA